MGAVAGNRPTAWRNHVPWLVDCRQKNRAARPVALKLDRAALHVSSTLRRGYPWQVASPQSLRPFHLVSPP